MDTQQLRRGNIVQDLSRMLRVEEVKELAVRCSYIKPVNDHWSILDADTIEGIPLTEELLLKNTPFKKKPNDSKKKGYEYGVSPQYRIYGFDGIVLYRDKKTKVIHFDFDGICFDYHCEKVIESLHDLQNLFQSLIGQELEINL